MTKLHRWNTNSTNRTIWIFARIFITQIQIMSNKNDNSTHQLSSSFNDKAEERPIDWLVTTTCLFVFAEGCQTKLPDQNNFCVICSTSSSRHVEFIQASCGHFYHSQCFYQRCQKYDHCPACWESIGLRLFLALDGNQTKDSKCMICLKDQPSSLTFRCHHTFHPECISEPARLTRKCILCRWAQMTLSI